VEPITTTPSQDLPQVYRIEISGYLPERWAVWFEGMEFEIVQNEREGKITAIFGPVPDQAALHGLLTRIRDLGLVLLRVEKITPQPGDPAIDI
jgi:hypothetical protein